PGQLEMLLLVISHGNVSGAINKDVSSHQAGIVEQADRGVLAVLAGLLLELRHAIQPAHARHAVEDPSQFGMLRNPALIEDDMFLRIDARGQVGGRDLAGLVGKVVMDESGRQRMQVNHAIDAVEAFLECDELPDSTEIIAEMK